MLYLYLATLLPLLVIFTAAAAGDCLLRWGFQQPEATD